MKKPRQITKDAKPVSFSRLYWDIETEAREDAHEFAPDFQARGNLKDPAKIEADIAEKRAEWISSAALSPITGRVLVFAYAVDDEPVKLIEGDEERIVDQAWGLLSNTIHHGGRAIGFNTTNFDLPFLAVRAAANGVIVPPGLYQARGGRWSWSEFLVDLMTYFMAGQREFRGYSLKNAAKLFGLPQKEGSGADFSNLYKSDRTKAVEYVTRDVELVRALADTFAI